MAYSFTAASSQYLSTSTAYPTYPYTMACAFKKSGTEDQSLIFHVGASGSIREGITLTYATARTLNALSGSSVATTTTTFTDGTWGTSQAIFNSNASRKIYFNAGGSATNTATVSATYTRIFIGARIFNGSLAATLNGDSCECAIWSVALSDDEITSLSKGFKPTRIRPQSLVFYAPLIRNLQDTRGGLTITNNNSATVADHPRVY